MADTDLQTTDPSGPEAFDSAAYWRARYRRGGTSGAGSYGRLAVYKAHVINELVHRHGIDSVVELGSGDGNQAALFDIPRYTGIDVAPKVVTAARNRFTDREGWRFYVATSPRVQKLRRHDLSMSLDVIYHLVEDEVFEGYMTQLFDLSGAFVLIYASDHDAAADARHVRHREYSAWIKANRPDWTAVETLPQPFPMVDGADKDRTSFAFFRLYRREA